VIDQLTGAPPSSPPEEHPDIRRDSRLTAALVRAYEADGQWRRTPLRALLAAAAAEQPDRVAAIDRMSVAHEARRFTYAELDERAHLYACGLPRWGSAPATSSR